MTETLPKSSDGGRRGSRPRLTIERLRTFVLIGGGLLVAAIAIFLVAGGWTRRLLTKDLPKRLGIDIESQADGVNYTQSRKGKTVFKIHAARAVRMKLGDKTLLHDVVIHLYGVDGVESDTISGSEFEYDPGTGIANAAGAVEITLMRPQEKPAIVQLKAGGAKIAVPAVKSSPLATSAAGGAKDTQIHVKTSGLIFNQKTGLATTEKRVDFTLQQGSGTSIGATYDSSQGHLVLDHAVELHIIRPQSEGNGGPVTVHASHAEFERTQQICELTEAQADSDSGTAQMLHALIHFRPDGSVTQMDGSGGVDLRTESGSHVTAPNGTLAFDEHNRPKQGLLTGGARLEMTQPNRQISGSAPTAKLQFNGEGQLRQAHLEQGVRFHSTQQTTNAKGVPAVVQRSWKSQTADIAFAPVAGARAAAQASAQASQTRVEPRTIHGYGGVVVDSETASAGVVSPSKLAADTVVAVLASGGALTAISGNGHASFAQQTAAGAHQASSSDQLDVRFLAAKADSTGKSGSGGTASEIASVVEVGHVILTQEAQARQSAIRATADRSDYDGKTQLLQLTGSPRFRDGSLDLTANRIDFARESGDAFAHGDVRASWSGAGGAGQGAPPAGASLLATGPSSSGGNNGPVHAIAAEAELHQATQLVVFRGAASGSAKGEQGSLPRLWQAANSVSAPVITLNRQKQTLDAESGNPANPVVTVLVTNPPGSGSANASAKSASGRPQKSGNPSVIRVRSGDLHYSEGERIALFHGGSLGQVKAQTTDPDGTSTVVSQQAEVKLYPAGTRAAGSGQTGQTGQIGQTGNRPGNSAGSSPASSGIDQMIALGHVTVDWPDRKGTGEKLVYRSEDGNFTLTGSSTVPPRITDQARGNVTGSALIFHSRDDSVTVEGDGGKTVTETHSKK